MDEKNSSMMKFGLKVASYILHKNLVSSDNKNIVCSPLSIDTVANIIALGSKGETLEQLLELIGCNNVHDVNSMASTLSDVVKESKGALEISSANALWVDQRYSLKDSFQQVLADLHRAQVSSADFKNKVDEVVEEVNKWAKKESRGLIKEIISKNNFKETTVLLLVNALYFKGTWDDKFYSENTEDRDFYLLNGNTIRVPFMNKTCTDYDYGTFEECQVLKMPYKYEEQFSMSRDVENPRIFSMYLFLPEKKDGLSNLLEKFHNMDYSTIFNDKLILHREEISKLSIPKFDFQCQLPLEEHMNHLGLTLPFDEDCEDLTGIVNLPTGYKLFVTEILQTCRVLVDEDGTKAVAITSAMMECLGFYISNKPPIDYFCG